MIIKSALQYVLKLFDLRIMRGAKRPIQYDDTQSVLENLKRMGYEPCFIIDGGAHLGSFALMARRVFPQAIIHMVEPQKACHVALQDITLKDKRIRIDACLLSSSNQPEVFFIDDGDKPTTGARAAPSDSQTKQVVAAKTLDILFSVDAQRPCLLKLDLQGHELEALKGGLQILRSVVDIAIIETSCFVEHSEPKSLEIMNFMHELDFDLFDISSMGRRSRDKRLRQVDMIFAKRGTTFYEDRGWQ